MTGESAQIVALPEHRVSLLDAYLRGLPSAATRKVYKRAIKAFDMFTRNIELLDATRRDVEAYRAHLEELGRAPATIAQHMSALTGYYDYAVDEEAISRNPASRARRPKVPSTSPRHGVEVEESRRILQVCCTSTDTLIDMRDCALITTLAVQGWRISEALGLHVEDLGEEAGYKVAEVRGKGGTVVRVPLAAATWQALHDWLTVSGIESGPVFVPVLKGGRLVAGKSISKQAAWDRVRHVAERAGLNRHVHPHLFRHGAVTAALDADVPLREVQDFARHADPRTTRRYDSHRQSLNNRTPHTLAAKLGAGPREPGGAG